MRHPVSLLVGVALLAAATLAAQSKGVVVTPNESARRVDVTVDGKPFTSYIYPTSLKKPTLFPIRSAKGTLITSETPTLNNEGVTGSYTSSEGLKVTPCGARPASGRC